MDNISTVTNGGPIKKYAHSTPSADGVSSLFLASLCAFVSHKLKKKKKLKYSNAL
jgi:hypothetical protein